jgi:small-conductance mechanosensitive channel
MDRMNATELAANQFRMTQTRDKLARDSIRDQQHAIHAHEQVGKEVRDAIKRIGGHRRKAFRRRSTSRKWKSGSRPRHPSWNSMSAMRAVAGRQIRAIPINLEPRSESLLAGSGKRDIHNINDHDHGNSI